MVGSPGDANGLRSKCTLRGEGGMEIEFICTETDEGLRKLVDSDCFVVAHGLESLRDPRFGPLVEGELRGLPVGPRRIYLKSGNGTPPGKTMLVRLVDDPSHRIDLDLYATDGWGVILPAGMSPDQMWRVIIKALSILEVRD